MLSSNANAIFNLDSTGYKICNCYADFKILKGEEAKKKRKYIHGYVYVHIDIYLFFIKNSYCN